MRRRLHGLVVAAVTALAVSAPTAPARAVPGGTCTIQAPASVSITRPVEHVPVTLLGDCVANHWSYASWDVVHTAYGMDGISIFDGNDSASWDVYDVAHTGRYAIEPSASWDADHGHLSQNTAASTVRYGSRTRITMHRTGAFLTLRARVTRYRSPAQAFRPWRTATRFQYRSPDGVWHTLRAGTTGRKGYTSVRLRAPRARVYRASTAGISTTWGSSTVAHRR
jgi:hypothetical protein